MIKLTPWDTSRQLQTEEEAVLYLQACLEQAPDDKAFISRAICTVARSPAMEQHDELRKQILTQENHDYTLTLRRLLAKLRSSLPVK